MILTIIQLIVAILLLMALFSIADEISKIRLMMAQDRQPTPFPHDRRAG